MQNCASYWHSGAIDRNPLYPLPCDFLPSGPAAQAAASSPWSCVLGSAVAACGPTPGPELERCFQDRVRPRGHFLLCRPPESSPHPGHCWPPNLHLLVPHAESSLPGVQTVLSAKGVLDGEPPVVEFQGRKAAPSSSSPRGPGHPTWHCSLGGIDTQSLTPSRRPRRPPLPHLAGPLSFVRVEAEIGDGDGVQEP